MVHDLFGEITFQVGWKGKKNIQWFGSEHTVTLKIQAYFEEDGITDEQEKSYALFCKMESQKLQTAEKLLAEYSDFAKTQFVPTMLLFNRDGSYALLCDDKEAPDEGVAVCLSPKETVLSQDDYL